MCSMSWTLVFTFLVQSTLLAADDAGCSAQGSQTSCMPFTSLLQTRQVSAQNRSEDNSFSFDNVHNLDVASDSTHHARKANDNILYVIRTWHKNYDTRLPSILQTWAKTIDNSSILIVGDEDFQNPTVHAATGCTNDHRVGLTCKTGHSLALAAETIGTHGWAFVIDDDVYVNTSHLEGVLKKQDSSRLVALGIPGCGTPHCDDHQGGFCGGGGYALSQAALKALVDKPAPKDFHNELLDMTKVFYPGETAWDDVTTTCLIKRRGIAVEKMEGLYGWRLPDSNSADPDGKLSPGYRGAIHSLSPLPLTFHYITPKEMYTIHDQFMLPERQVVSLLQEPPSYSDQVRQHIHREHLRRSAA